MTRAFDLAWLEKRAQAVGATASTPEPRKPRQQPIKPIGKRGKRLQKADRRARAEVKERDGSCVACQLFGAPLVTTRSGPDEWAHVHGRRTHKGADLRHDPRYAVRLCPSHHDWHHGRGQHALGIRCVVKGEKVKQIFTVDGLHEQSRTL